MPRIDDALKADIVKWSAFYEHRIRMGSKVIFHLEAFVAKFMRIYEGYVSSRRLQCGLITDTRCRHLMGMMDMDFDD